MKRTAIYARYSSSSQSEQSIEGQLHVCNAYAQEHGLEVCYTYIDRAITGKTDDREEFQQMIKDGKAGRLKSCWSTRPTAFPGISMTALSTSASSGKLV